MNPPHHITNWESGLYILIKSSAKVKNKEIVSYQRLKGFTSWLYRIGPD